jgi:hypothetical protein
MRTLAVLLAAALAALLAALAGLVLTTLLLTGLVLAALLLAGLTRLARLVLAGVVLLMLRIVLFVRHRDVLRHFEGVELLVRNPRPFEITQEPGVGS